MIGSLYHFYGNSLIFYWGFIYFVLLLLVHLYKNLHYSRMSYFRYDHPTRLRSLLSSMTRLDFLLPCLYTSIWISKMWIPYRRFQSNYLCWSKNVIFYNRRENKPVKRKNVCPRITFCYYDILDKISCFSTDIQ